MLVMTGKMPSSRMLCVEKFLQVGESTYTSREVSGSFSDVIDREYDFVSDVLSQGSRSTIFISLKETWQISLSRK